MPEKKITLCHLRVSAVNHFFEAAPPNIYLSSVFCSLLSVY